MGRTRRRFTKEFKAEAVALLGQGGKSIGETARDLDLVKSVLRRWVRRADVAGAGDCNGTLAGVDKEELMRRSNETGVDTKQTAA